MKKVKIYLDTSVISHLLADDAPENMGYTQELWKLLQQGEYEIVISNLTFDELDKCDDKKRAVLTKYLKLLNYFRVPITPQQDELAQKYLQYSVLSKKSMDDYWEEFTMKNRIIEELHRIREQHYEETKDLPLEERLKRINRSGDEFQKLVDRARQEPESSFEIL